MFIVRIEIKVDRRIAMATSSFSRKFIISQPQAIEQLIHSMENPTQIKLEKRDSEQEKQLKQAILCKLQARLASTKL